MMDRRPLGTSGVQVSPVAMGCWPIAGMTSLGVTRAASVATVDAALDAGINFFDTAHCYGAEGESELILGETLRDRRADVVIATKGGIHWGPDRERVIDGSPERLRWECELSLQRLGIDGVDLLYLHAPDPRRPIEESAQAMRQLQQEGKTLAVGVSNVTLSQLQQFHAVCPVAAIQPAYNMLMREIEQDLVPWCLAHQVAVCPYWPLMKGLLAGKLPRDHQFDPGDGRAKYPMFQGEEWSRNQDLVDRLRELAIARRRTVADLVINWTISQSGITSALCGAKRPDQIRESALAMQWTMDQDTVQAIADALQDRGPAATMPAV